MIDPKVFKQVRKALGLSQQELADALRLSRVTVNKMERGKLARGIPDDIGARLMLLKPRGSEPHVKILGASEALKQQAVKSFREDDHLWDNEEDES